MTLGSVLRRGVWTALDYAKGRPIGRHIDDLAWAMEDPGAIGDRQARLLDDLLRHATTSTAHYRQFAGVTCLDELPVLQKQDIRQDYESFVSAAFDRESLVPVTTSGSYGTPFTFLLTREKKARQLAEIIYFGGWCGYRIGDRHAYVRVTSAKSPLRLYLQNEVLMNPSRISTEWLASCRTTLHKGGIRAVIGYPSAIGAIAAYCQARGDDPSHFELQSVITSAEALLPVTRDLISAVFGCPAFSRYSTEEFGVLAQECECGRHHVNSGSYIVELLAIDGSEAASPGTLGRVVVTDLYSHAMPLLRYDTGDLAIASDECSCGRHGPVLSSLQGRAVEEVTDSKGQRLSPFAINGAMRDVEQVLQFQFAQLGHHEYQMRLVTLPEFSSEDLVRQRLGTILGADARLGIEYADQIEPLSSGKRPYIVNEWRRRGDARCERG
jgi:phenylacetate-CoA ligase